MRFVAWAGHAGDRGLWRVVIVRSSVDAFAWSQAYYNAGEGAVLVGF
jgi:hypothetical protein